MASDWLKIICVEFPHYCKSCDTIRFLVTLRVGFLLEFIDFATIAQSVVRLTCNQEVEGSIPSRSTSNSQQSMTGGHKIYVRR